MLLIKLTPLLFSQLVYLPIALAAATLLLIRPGRWGPQPTTYHLLYMGQGALELLVAFGAPPLALGMSWLATAAVSLSLALLGRERLRTPTSYSFYQWPKH